MQNSERSANWARIQTSSARNRQNWARLRGQTGPEWPISANLGRGSPKIGRISTQTSSPKSARFGPNWPGVDRDVPEVNQIRTENDQKFGPMLTRTKIVQSSTKFGPNAARLGKMSAGIERNCPSSANDDPIAANVGPIVQNWQEFDYNWPEFGPKLPRFLGHQGEAGR